MRRGSPGGHVLKILERCPVVGARVIDVTWYHIHILMMARAALRFGELAGSRWPDIAFLDDGTATITVCEARYEGEVSAPKCKARKLREPNYVPKSMRTIALSEDLADALRQHRQVQKELGRTHKDDLVFTTRTGAVLRPSNFRLDVFNDAVTVALATGKVRVKGANPKPITHTPCVTPR